MVVARDSVSHFEILGSVSQFLAVKPASDGATAPEQKLLPCLVNVIRCPESRDSESEDVDEARKCTTHTTTFVTPPETLYTVCVSPPQGRDSIMGVFGASEPAELKPVDPPLAVLPQFCTDSGSSLMIEGGMWEGVGLLRMMRAGPLLKIEYRRTSWSKIKEANQS